MIGMVQGRFGDGSGCVYIPVLVLNSRRLPDNARHAEATARCLPGAAAPMKRRQCGELAQKTRDYMIRRRLCGCLVVSLLMLLAACAHAPPGEPNDPLESVNRVTFEFNRTADKYAIRPLARGYEKVTPTFVRTGVGNFFDNLFSPVTIVNSFLQGKFERGGAAIGRLLLNTTLGWGGLFDVAQSHFGLEKHSEDFGQTLGYWGVGPGWYLVLPLLGPSTTRDAPSRVADLFLNPLYYAGDNRVVWSLAALHVVNTRALLLRADRFIEEALDPYLFVRDAYLQRRRYQVYDGNPPPVPLEAPDIE